MPAALERRSVVEWHVGPAPIGTGSINASWDESPAAQFDLGSIGWNHKGRHHKTASQAIRFPGVKAVLEEILAQSFTRAVDSIARVTPRLSASARIALTGEVRGFQGPPACGADSSMMR